MYWPTVIIILVKNGAALSLENFTVLYNLNTIYRESIYKEFFTKTIVLSQTKLFINQLDFFLYNTKRLRTEYLPLSETEHHHGNGNKFSNSKQITNSGGVRYFVLKW